MRVYCRKAIVHRPVAFGESPHPTNSQSELPTFPTRGKASFFRSVWFIAVVTAASTAPTFLATFLPHIGGSFD